MSVGSSALIRTSIEWPVVNIRLRRGIFSPAASRICSDEVHARDLLGDWILDLTSVD